jgi:predicted acyl esterase
VITLDKLLSALSWRIKTLPRRLARSPIAVEQQDLELTSLVGYRIQLRVTRPVGIPDPQPLVISPGIHQGIAELEDWSGPVSPLELARLGYCVVSHDPAGRGKSWGEEDFGGLEHQDDLKCTIQLAAQLPGVKGKVGVLSLSLGIAAAAGALASHELPVAWLVDWEGPCDREIITSGGTIMVPANGHKLTDDDYWEPREAVRHIGKIRCGYTRLQAFPDHAQPQEVRHAERMIDAAKNAGLPWFQLNDHPRNQLPPRPNYLGGGMLAANRAILRKLKALKQ